MPHLGRDNARSPTRRLRSRRAGNDANGSEYWMVGGAKGMLFTKGPNGKWGLFDAPYSVFQLYSSLTDQIPAEWVLRRRILGELTSKSEVRREAGL